ncbi:MAG: DUF4384 domain-containing protein, partial [Rhodothermaceae bacterium]|nr:DUF4384 domain-containing protein [Rhodothermaceae bacterium]
SGHGHRSKSSFSIESIDDLRPRYHQYIIPFDFKRSAEVEFNGILNIELSALLGKLTEITNNVTVVLDCCHAALMARDGSSLTPKKYPTAKEKSHEIFLEFYRQNDIDLTKASVVSNPNAVRLVAASKNQSAYEYTNDKGLRGGLLTDSLLNILEELKGAPVSWRFLVDRIRERVQSVAPMQRPEVEGSVARYLLSTEKEAIDGVLSYFNDNDKPSLRGGSILGVNVNDIYSIKGSTASSTGSPEEIARATVSSVSTAISRVSLTPPDAVIENGALATPVKLAFRKRCVVISGDDPSVETLKSRIKTSRFLTVAEKDNLSGVIATVHVHPEGIEIHNSLKALVLQQPPGYKVSGVVNRLEMLARAQMLREMENNWQPAGDQGPFTVIWGKVKGENTEPLTMDGAALTVGDHIYVSVKNTTNSPLYIWIFDIGIAGKVTLLTQAEPSGTLIKPEEDYTLGRIEYKFVGLPLGWPTGVPKIEEQTESLVIIASNLQQDLRPLETHERALRGKSIRSSLQQLLNQVYTGTTRDFKPIDHGDTGKYAVRHIYFNVKP